MAKKQIRKDGERQPHGETVDLIELRSQVHQAGYKIVEASYTEPVNRRKPELGERKILCGYHVARTVNGNTQYAGVQACFHTCGRREKPFETEPVALEAAVRLIQRDAEQQLRPTPKQIQVERRNEMSKFLTGLGLKPLVPLP